MNIPDFNGASVLIALLPALPLSLYLRRKYAADGYRGRWRAAGIGSMALLAAGVLLHAAT